MCKLFVILYGRMEEVFSTPMMKQYLKLKSEYQDCVLFYRMGDFYEMFMEDAEIGARVLDITLTSRDKGSDKKIMMAGVPYHVVDNYIVKMINAGYRVAIAEQVSDPKLPGIVERKVVRVVTPGTVMLGDALTAKESRYLMAVSFEKDEYGLAVVDVGTGVFKCSQFKNGEEGLGLIDELTRINPYEIILSSALSANVEFMRFISTHTKANIFGFRDWSLYAKKSVNYLEEKLGKSIEVWGLDRNNDKLAIEAASAVLGYVEYTQKRQIVNIKDIAKYVPGNQMYLDKSAIKNLEVFETLVSNELRGSLISVVDQTLTPMGARLIRSWLSNPLVQLSEINFRSKAVAYWYNSRERLSAIRNWFKQVRDIERLIGRLSNGWGNARDLVGLRESLRVVLQIKSVIKFIDNALVIKVDEMIEEKLVEVVKLLDLSIGDEPPVDTKSGKMIAIGYNNELDELRSVSSGGRDWILEYEKTERLRSGIANLKVRYNKVFGYYIEVSKGSASKVPDNYVRKQTLVNAERFFTEDLKMYEDKVLSAESKIFELELNLFLDIVEKVISQVESILDSAKGIAELDCICGLAYLAINNKYVEPEWNDDGRITLIDSRHPVLEIILNNQFVSNDVSLDHNSRQVLIVTGPNMAGKSVYLRQVAVICLMAQIGSWVPAKNANICVVDRIFVRSGASDVMTKGLSTFMVEMIETAGILVQASENSLIIMDEIGRGTSTYDGISLAWSIAESLVSGKFKKNGIVRGPKTLFATHYHELQQLEEENSLIKNVQVAVVDQKGSPVFLHKIVDGGASHSYGVAVAKMAGVPDEIIDRAKEILNHLEGKRISRPPKKLIAKQLAFGADLNNYLVDKLREIDLNNLTPIQAIKILDELKSEI